MTREVYMTVYIGIDWSQSKHEVGVHAKVDTVGELVCLPIGNGFLSGCNGWLRFIRYIRYAKRSVAAHITSGA